jgi:diguanylate cyclase (GGDEF)-like protein
MPIKKIFFYIKIFLFSLVIAASLSVFLYIYKIHFKNIDTTVKVYHNKTSAIINGYFEHFSSNSAKLFDVFFSNEDILTQLENGQKEQFYKSVEPFYKRYLLSEPSLWGMNIILRNGESFLLVHSPDSIDLRDNYNKSIVKKALESRKMQSSFEAGECGYFYKVVYPIFHNGKFLGVSEFSYKLIGFIDFIYQHFDLKAAFVFKNIHGNDLPQGYTKQTQDGYIVEYASPQVFGKYLEHISIDSKNDNRYTSVDGSEYSVRIFPLPDVQNLSRLVSFYDITSMSKKATTSMYSLAVILFIFSSLMLFLINKIINFSTNKISLKEAEVEKKDNELHFNSRHNQLTKLPNVNVMNEAALTHENYSVIMLNIDNVPILNTTYGKDVVESIFKETAKCLEYNLSSNGILYHMSMDEFAIILDDPSANQEMMLAAQIKAYFEHTPMCVQNLKVYIQFSMGIGIHKEDDKNRLNVFSQANIALVEAKHRAKGLILMYSDDMSSFGSYTQLAKNIAILQRDLENESLTPFYQPIVDTYTQKIVKYEVLSRIKDEKGFIPPNKFMEAAEVSGLQTAITKQVTQKACKYFEGSDVEFSINITKHDLMAKYLPEFLASKTKTYNIKPQNLTLEILEDIAIEDNEEMIEQINFLSSLGYVIAIDDFGVESSNISKLSDLDADFIKIDGTFIKDMDTNEKHLHIVESLVYMAKKLEMKVVAEFVHSEEIYDIVKRLGIDYSQGYYFSPPKEHI